MMPEFYIFYLESLKAQRKIDARFKKSSTPKINNCAVSLYQKKGKRASGNYKDPPVHNGPVPSTVRLACAICYFAGSSPYNLGCVYSISYRSVLESVWNIVEAINMMPEFYIFYLESLKAQRKIDARFKKSSTPKINNCAGAIDGKLIWTTKPSLADAKSRIIDQKKYLCGRKHKFGLNCQAVSDSWGRFVDVSIIYGGSTADCLVFEGSDLYKWLIKGLMKQDLGKQPFVLFGDNAYLNSSFMATPYPNVSNNPGTKTKDDYIFYHSQL
eukprot:CCRYP_011015-RA/>CCRYP_011015-RA protein AED:0.23 eAED:0.04 QI:0/0/0/1/0/0/2/0/269